MRILYFTRDYTPHDHRFLSALAKSGHSVSSLRFERRGMQREDRSLPPEIEQIHWVGGQRPFRWRDLPVYRRDLKRVVRQVKPDVVHAGSVQSAAFLTALAGVKPLVSMSWGSDLLVDADRNRWMRWITRFTLSKTSVLVGDCVAVQKKAAGFDFPKERVVLFPWGVDLEQFSPGDKTENKNRLGWQEEFVILSLRSWEPLYGVEILVRAFLRAAAQVPDLRLLLLGAGSQATEIHSLIQRSGLDGQVYFGGQVTNQELPRYYRSADLYVSASHSDGSSVSLMEALACGCSALVSNIPGNAEWIEPGVQGWLFQDGDEAALTDGILRAFRSKSLLPQMGQAARALAEERADWNKNFAKLESAYQMAVAFNRSKAGR